MATDFGVDLRTPDAADSSAPDGASPPDQGVAMDGAGLDSGKDLGGTITKYSAMIPDAAVDTGFAPVDTAPVYTALMPDAGPRPDGLAVRYMAQMPDA
jgi:hypothetical protein